MAILGYEVVEDALYQQFLGHFSNELNTNRLQKGDVDVVIDGLFGEDAKYGCVLDFGGGGSLTGAPFSDPGIQWDVLGIFLVRYSDDIEEDLRHIVSKLATSVNSNPRLGNTTALARLVAIDTPEQVNVNEVPFYWIGFQISILDR